LTLATSGLGHDFFDNNGGNGFASRSGLLAAHSGETAAKTGETAEETAALAFNNSGGAVDNGGLTLHVSTVLTFAVGNNGAVRNGHHENQAIHLNKPPEIQELTVIRARQTSHRVMPGMPSGPHPTEPGGPPLIRSEKPKPAPEIARVQLRSEWSDCYLVYGKTAKLGVKQ